MAIAATQKENIQKIRRELAAAGVYPYQLAATAIQRNEQLLEHIARLERQLLLRP